ncbi:Helicase conserved C-terminal domain-containing protein [Lachnospiraceae bacterium KH1T2]|nr:Helicase conserved C-terminal domain-containing protein [Lachnospiraceae bacterium KH1T2]
MDDKRLDGRKELIRRMKREMLGPGSEISSVDIEHEVISGDPGQRYCIGILYPQGNTIGLEEDDLDNKEGNAKEDVDFDNFNPEKNINTEDTERYRLADTMVEDTMDENINMATRLLPSSMGLTFISKVDLKQLVINGKFAKYRASLIPDCKIKIDDLLADDFCVPEVFDSFYEYDKTNHILSLKSKVLPKQIKYWYDQDKADDGFFKNYAYKMLELLKGKVRVPYEFETEINFSDGAYYNSNLEIEGVEAGICALKHKLVNGFYSYTIMLINMAKGKPGKDNLYQPEISIDTDKNGLLVFNDYSELDIVQDYTEEEASNSLLYRNHKKYGTGLGVSVNWNISDEGKGQIYTDFFPTVEVPQMEFTVDEKYNVPDKTFSMKYLSDLDSDSKENKIAYLKQLSEGYNSWIGEIESKIHALPNHHFYTAQRHISNCRYCQNRIAEGICELENNPPAWDAFQLANRAMYMQRVQIVLQSKFEDVYPDNDELGELLEDMNYYEQPDSHFWRPFQLAFLLMSVTSMSNDNVSNKERDIVDLIWFPTGGGKTEAYLGLAAFTIFYRRLSHLSESGGTAIIMRYTLRLLAAQQFTRASTLICACELIRQEAKRRSSSYPRYDLGDDEINIGLWIGGAHTPNKNKEAVECYDKLSKAINKNLEYTKEKYNKFQVLKCPWCGTKLVKDIDKRNKVVGKWGYRLRNKKHFYLCCTHESCLFNDKLPLQIVDEELYDNPPTLLFATVDKFAMMPWYGEIGRFFATDTNNRTPELIIQDELHLISGPLGSMVGLYEAAIDYLCCHKGIKPKIIASTATICKAKEQCSSLYNREVFQFPPQGIDEADSFFAKSADISKKSGREYVGLMPSGKTKAMMESRVLASLLQIVKESRYDDEVKDTFWTLTTYFNSLKELGKCSTIVQNDVRDNIERMAHRNNYLFGKRTILKADELTSRISTTELNRTLNRLEKIHYSKENWENKIYPVNLLLATNMISVGIDVDRLNSMVIIGQPKLTSEYIQASSRVGRKFPGVVFVQYDGARSRDRSHYEQFKSYHESFYRYVEPTGVTPFSEPSRKRALHAVLVSMIRHMYFETDDELRLFDKEKYSKELRVLSQYIINRIDSVNKRLTYEVSNECNEIEDEIEIIYERINRLVEHAEHERIEYGNIMGYKNPDWLRILKPFGVDEDEYDSFNTMTSMRNVEASVNVNVIVLGEDNE